MVGGWTPGEGNARDLGALVVGVYEDDGRLRFTGKVGSASRARPARTCSPASRRSPVDEAPFDPPPPKDYKGRWGGELTGVTWVRPEVVIRAELGGWSRDGMVRQTSFKGFEEGRDPTTVVRETPVETAAAIEEAESEAVDGAEADGAIDGPDADDGVDRNDGMAGAISPTKGRTSAARKAAQASTSDDHRTATATKTRQAATTTGKTSREDGHHMKTNTKAEPPTAKSRPGTRTKRTGPDAEAAFSPVTEAELAALDALGKEGVWQRRRRRAEADESRQAAVPTSNSRSRASPGRRRPGRKARSRSASSSATSPGSRPTMLPHLRDRPLNLQRFPNGAGAPGLLAEGHPRDGARSG